jgi:hypothetical protein
MTRQERYRASAKGKASARARLARYRSKPSAKATARASRTARQRRLKALADLAIAHGLDKLLVDA